MLIETKIATMRHARTDYNAEKRYAGTIDIPLNEKGIQEAREAAGKLSQYQFDVVVTSTLKRSLQTAQLIFNNTIPTIQSELCNERNFGIMEGCTWEEVLMFQPPVLMIEVGNDLHTVNPKGGEPFENVWERAKKFRRFLFKQYKGLSILVISHGVFLQMFHGVLQGRNCIESLDTYPSNLELATFFFNVNRLVEEKVVRLIEKSKDVQF